MPEDSKEPLLTDFYLPKSEVNADLETGEFGNLLVPVEVINVTSDSVFFRRHGKAMADGAFKAESLEQMRERIGIVEDEEKSITEQENEDNDD